LLLTVFPASKRTVASTIWSMTTVLAPIAGPLLGGTISDNWTWPWIFYINLPVVALCGVLTFRLMRPYETRTKKLPIDFVGLALLLIWVGSLQVMLDTGREKDWFSNDMIVAEAITAVVFFVLFVIWELTDQHPVVDLRVMRHRGFTVGSSLIGLGFFGMMSALTVVPLWLQTNLGFTATWSGSVSATVGILAFASAPIVAKLIGKTDPRRLVFAGFLWLALVNYLRSGGFTQMDFWSIAIGQGAMGAGMMLFMITNLTMAMGAVRPEETASAAGILNFMRTMAIAVGTSLWTSVWVNGATIIRDGMVGPISKSQLSALPDAQALRLIEQLTDQEALTRSINQVFLYVVFVFLAGCALVWLIPKPKGPVAISSGH
jgi:DHA2 family multidrug resistance protein